MDSGCLLCSHVGFEPESLTEPGVHHSTSWLTIEPRGLHCPLHSSGITEVESLVFNVSAEDLNLGLHACAASSLPTEPFLSPAVWLEGLVLEEAPTAWTS